MHAITSLFMIALFMPIVLIIAITPIITRKVEAFGVTVPEGVKKEPFVMKQIKIYMALCIGLGAVLVLGMFAMQLKFHDSSFQAVAFSFIMLAYVVITFIFYYVAHVKMKKWKQTQSWYDEQLATQKIVVQTGFHNQKMTISLAWYLPHLLLVAGTIMYSLLNFEKFPDLIPMQYSFSGEVTRSVPKRLSSVLLLSGISLAMIVVFIVSHFSIAKSKQVVESKDPEGSIERNRRFRYSWSVFLAITGFLVVLLMCIGQLSPLFNWSSNTFLFFCFTFVGLIVFGALILSIRTGQGGSRIKLAQSQGKPEITAVADLDKYWKAGIFYWNPNDPAIFVEKRFGIGWSINYARPLSWIVIIGIVVIVIIPAIFLS